MTPSKLKAALENAVVGALRAVDEWEAEQERQWAEHGCYRRAYLPYRNEETYDAVWHVFRNLGVKKSMLCARIAESLSCDSEARVERVVSSPVFKRRVRRLVRQLRKGV